MMDGMPVRVVAETNLERSQRLSLQWQPWYAPKSGECTHHRRAQGVRLSLTYATCAPLLLLFLLQTLRLADFMMKKTMGFSGASAPTAAGAVVSSDASPMAWNPVPVTPPRPLDLALSPASLRAIATAEAAFDQLVDDHEVRYHVCVCDGRGKNRSRTSAYNGSRW